MAVSVGDRSQRFQAQTGRVTATVIAGGGGACVRAVRIMLIGLGIQAPLAARPKVFLRMPDITGTEPAQTTRPGSLGARTIWRDDH